MEREANPISYTLRIFCGRLDERIKPIEAYMFGLKTKKQKLEVKLKKLLEEAYQLSHTNRRKSDEKAAEAEGLRKQIEALD